VTEQLGRRCALVLLAALSFAMVVGLLAWGPIRLDGLSSRFADPHRLAGLPNGAVVLTNLPIVLAGLWGWVATRRSSWPREVRLPWQAFHGCVIVGGLTSALHHLMPSEPGFVAAQFVVSAAFVMLTFGVLAERVSPRFGSPGGLRLAGMLVGIALALVTLDAAAGSAIDLRPFVALQFLPVLLIPSGAVSLPGPLTRSADWLAMLSLYAAGKILDAADAQVLLRTGWIGGHSLMHLCLAGVVAWLAYRAACAPAAGTATACADDSSKCKTSLTTAS
jgi:hypothetical protein